VAVAAFLAGRIGFLDIPRIIATVLDRVAAAPADTLEQVVAADTAARSAAHNLLD
jgi:1-deoxy-D-xylulose-5-phosphate reductoisomerase